MTNIKSQIDESGGVILNNSIAIVLLKCKDMSNLSKQITSKINAKNKRDYRSNYYILKEGTSISFIVI